MAPPPNEEPIDEPREEPGASRGSFGEGVVAGSTLGAERSTAAFAFDAAGSICSEVGNIQLSASQSRLTTSKPATATCLFGKALISKSACGFECSFECSLFPDTSCAA